MKAVTAILIVSVGLTLQGCVQLTGIERTDVSQVKPGANRQIVEKALGEPVETAETDMGLAAVYKYSSAERDSVLNDQAIAYYALMPYLWPFVEHEARKEKERLEAFLTIIYDEQDLISWAFTDNQIDALLKAGQGDSEAQYKLSLETMPLTERWRWVCRAAHSGHTKAMYELGNYNRWSLGMALPNQVRAYLWYTLAEDWEWSQRFKEKLTREMTPDQIAEAERLVSEWEPNPAECEAITAPVRSLERLELEERAHVGDAEAAYELANSARNRESKVMWLCLAANQGHRGAQYGLGNLYRYERGSVSPDPIRAYVWYSLAKMNGGSWADASRDRLAEEMTPSQVIEAQRLVEKWEPNPAECVIVAASLVAASWSSEAELQWQKANTQDLNSAAQRHLICQSANGGYPAAQRRMGILYLYPNEPEDQDLVKAYMWLQLAHLMDGEGSVAGASQKMTPEQLLEAERLVAEWAPNPVECETIGARTEN